MIERKELYAEFCRNHENAPVFIHPWWLDTVCGASNWGVSIAREAGGKITGALPYFLQRKAGFTLIRMPIVTPYLGPLLYYQATSVKPSSIYAFEKKTIRDLIQGIPGFHFFNQHFYPGFLNPLPFRWMDFETHLMTTYRLNLRPGPKALWKNLKSSVRSDIRNAGKSLIFTETDSIQEFHGVHEKSFHRQKIKVPVPFTFLQNFNTEIKKRKKGKMFAVKTQDGQLAASAYIIFDGRIVFTLMIGSDPDLRKGGAVQFLIWKMIETCFAEHDLLDFCGSMIEQIERVFRAFGARQTNYLNVRKIRHPLLKLSRATIGKPA